MVDPLVSLRPGGPNARIDGNSWMRATPPPANARSRRPRSAPPELHTKSSGRTTISRSTKQGRMPMGKPTDRVDVGDVEARLQERRSWFSTKPSSRRTPATSASRPAPPWRTGRTARCSFMPARKAPRRPFPPSRAGWAIESRRRRVHQRIHRRRFRQQDHRRHLADHPGAAFEEDQRAGDDAHQPRGRALHRPRTPQPCTAASRSASPRKAASPRSTCSWSGQRPVRSAGRRRIVRDASSRCCTSRRPCAGAAHGPDQHAAARFAKLARRHAGHRPHGAASLPRRRASSAIDQVAIRQHQRAGRQGAVRTRWSRGKRHYATSASSRKRSTRGAEQFKWDERKAAAGKRSGTKVRGIGVPSSCFVGGSVGFDGLFVIKPDGTIYIQSGIGNLGTESWSDAQRVAAEIIGVPWEKCDITWGNTCKNLPWSCPSGGSQTTHAMTRAAHAVACDGSEAAADRREGSRRQARRLRGRQRARLRTRAAAPA